MIRDVGIEGLVPRGGMRRLAHTFFGVAVAMVCTFASAASLRVDDGVVVKFGDEAGITAFGVLSGAGATFTSVADDTAGGALSATPGSPQPGDWRGLTFESISGETKMDFATVRYAGSNNGAAIEIGEGTADYVSMLVEHNVLGLRSGRGSQHTIGDSRIVSNATGLVGFAYAGAVVYSEIAGNDTIGVSSSDPDPALLLNAQSNWWGSSSGPTHPTNPGGTGDAVSDRVDYSDFLTSRPLVRCDLRTLDGLSSTTTASVSLALRCSGATEYQMWIGANAPGVYSPMVSTVPFTLPSSAGTYTIYIEYKSAAGETTERFVTVRYAPDGVVTIVSPIEGSTIDQDTTLHAVVDSPSSVRAVYAYVGNQLLGVLPRNPDGNDYFFGWSLEGAENGSYELRVVAELEGGAQSLEETRLVNVHRTGTVPVPPQIDNVELDGVAMGGGVSTVTAPGMLAFDVTDAGSIATVTVSLGDQAVSVGSPASGRYSVPLDFGTLANGPSTIRITATNTQGAVASRQFAIDVAVPPPAPPLVSNPADGATVWNAALAVSGTAAPGSLVRIYVMQGASPVWNGHLAVAGPSGNFAATLLLPGHGAYTVHATATLQGRTSAPSSSATVTYASPTAPGVEIVTPAANAVVSTDTAILVDAQSTSGIEHVRISVGGRLLGTVTSAPYSVQWSIADYADGDHLIRVEARAQNGLVAYANRSVRVVHHPDDTSGPTIGNLRFSGAVLGANPTFVAPGVLSFDLTDASGLAGASVTLDAVPVAGSLDGNHYSAALDFAAVPNGASHALVIKATDVLGNQSQQTLTVGVNLPVPATPVLSSPTAGMTTPAPSVSVSGTADPGSRVRVYLGTVAVGAELSVAAAGHFGTSIPLPAEGTYQVSAEATSIRGTSARSTAISVTHAIPGPSVLFVYPPVDAEMSADFIVEASVSDQVPLSSVSLRVAGGTPVTLAQPPYTWPMDIETMPEGDVALEITAASTSGKQTVSTRSVRITKIPAHVPIVTPYTGEVLSATPSVSHGGQNVTIAGRAKASEGGAAVPNALLRLVLAVDGFVRRINVVTDAAGAFSFTFVPQTSDAGTYSVTALHPDEISRPSEASFTINRLSVGPTSLALRAARTVSEPLPFTVTASAGSGAQNVRFVAEAIDLPPGISIVSAPAVDVPAGQSRAIAPRFLASSTAGDTGTAYLTLYSDIGGVSTQRSRIAVPYRLSEPVPSLSAAPTSVRIGAKRGTRASGAVQISNRGALAAYDVEATLLTTAGSPNVPDWVRLESPQQLGDLAPNGTVTLQVAAAPGTSVPYGVYDFKLRVAGANFPEGLLDVGVVVTSLETGSVRFHAANIYTDPNGMWGTPTFGLEGARVRLDAENQTVTGVTAVTDSLGNATLSDLPLGFYRYRVNAPNHADATGRILVQPGVEVTEDTFLDYEVVSFEWDVTETTITDEYEVSLTALYQTFVPAPVMLIEPASITLPSLQVGEEFSGELTITNYGLLRADDVVFIPAVSDSKLQIEYVGDVPGTFDAKQRVRIGYKITAIEPFPGGSVSTTAGSGPSKLQSPIPGGSRGKAMAACFGYVYPMRVTYRFQCANGDVREAEGWGLFAKTYGQCEGGAPVWGGAWGGWGGPSGGGGAAGTSGISISDIPCTPDCGGCPCPGEGGGPGGPPGGGSGGSGAGGGGPGMPGGGGGP